MISLSGWSTKKDGFESTPTLISYVIHHQQSNKWLNHPASAIKKGGNRRTKLLEMSVQELETNEGILEMRVKKVSRATIDFFKNSSFL